QGSGLWHDQNKFMKYAQAFLLLCKVYAEISSATGSRQNYCQLRCILKAP
uniref:Uncharacterized protein n=1 Tax=Aegilops tauschii subsp. strangulata TaxID=200361 RepID=A0A452XR31_AEGTS